VLTRWGYSEQIGSAKRRLAGRRPAGKRWFITSQLHTMLIIPRPGKITLGSPPHETGRDSHEELHDATIDYSFAISAHEVTIEQFRSFLPTRPLAVKLSSDERCPMNFVNWYEALQYCRWLSEQPEEAIAEEQRCYPPVKEIGPGMGLPAGSLLRQGYRLPTEQEWEYAARAGSATRWFFGSSRAFLDKYAWSAHNGLEHIWPVGLLRPNPFGLFDIYGNVCEYCDARYSGRDPKFDRGLMRGGDYRSTPKFLRSAMSQEYFLMSRVSLNGFRIARTLPRSDVEDLDTSRIQSDNRTSVFP
jgi:formylglycine-generating enzyme required for sulfatase activity